MEQLFSNELFTQIVFWIGLVMGVANVITLSFPSVKENKYYNFIMKILNFFAGNIAKNKNLDSVK